MFKGEKKYYFLVGIVFLLAAFSAYYIFTSDNSTQVDTKEEETQVDETNESEELTVEVTVPERAEKAIYKYELNSEEKTAYEVLASLDEDEGNDFNVEFDSFDMGGETSYFVTSLLDYTPDSSKEFWKFFVNGEESNMGISSYEVSNGDVLSFEVDEINM